MQKFLATLFFSVMFHFSFAQFYVVKDDSVFYYEKYIANADAKTFDVYHRNNDFALDRSTVFYKGEPTTFNPNTFKLFENAPSFYNYLVDKNDVYQITRQVNNRNVFKKLNSKSPQKFRFTTRSLALDNEKLYWDFHPLLNSNAKSLTILNDKFYHDKKQVYLENAVLPLSVKGLKKIGRSDNDIDFLASGNEVCDDYGYCFRMDSNEIIYINFNYIKNKDQVRYRSKILNADASTFTVPIEELDHFAQDKNYDFYLNETFPIRVPERYKKDDSLKMFKVLISEAILKGFEQKNIFKIEDIPNLKIIYKFHDSENTEIKKGKYIYINDEPVKDADAPSFRIFNNDIAIDKNHIYIIYEGSKTVSFSPILHLKINNFKYLGDAYFTTNGELYYLGSPLDTKYDESFKINKNLKYFAQNKTFVFYNEHILQGLKPQKNAEINELGDYYYSYGPIIFYYDPDQTESEIQILENIKAAQFEDLDNRYSLVNGKTIYYMNRKIGVLQNQERILSWEESEGKFDLDQFQRNALITSRNKLFIYGVEIKDIKNFKIYNYYNDYFNYNGILYYKGKEISKCKECNYTEIAGATQFVSFNNEIFYEGSKLGNTKLEDINYAPKNSSLLILKNNQAYYNDLKFTIDSKTFEYFNYGYSKDKYFVYKDGIRTNLDPKTFFQFSTVNSFTLDKNGVYFDGVKINDADVATFQLLDDYKNIGFDKKYYFLRGEKILKTSVKLPK